MDNQGSVHQPSANPPSKTQPPPPGQYPPPGTYPPHYQPPPPPAQNKNSKLIWIIVGVACGCPLLIVIIGIIAAVVIPLFMHSSPQPTNEQAEAAARAVVAAESAYYADHGEYGSLSELVDAGLLDAVAQGNHARMEPGLTVALILPEIRQVYQVHVLGAEQEYYSDESGQIRSD
ncbi:hypothetical protein JW859_06580 [bacterium]|nr:hypothetical protein [bacterium]